MAMADRPTGNLVLFAVVVVLLGIIFVLLPSCTSSTAVVATGCANCPRSNSCPKTTATSSTGDQRQGKPIDSDAAGFDFSIIPEKYRDRCKTFLSQHSENAQKSLFSQFRQDWMLYHNYFTDASYYGEGFYVDVGANHATLLSNTIFFDKCLGWKGICVEPNPQYAADYKQRSCQLIPNCVYKEHKTLWFDMPRGVNKGTAGRILNCTDDGVCSDKGIGAKVKVECLTLDSILRDAGLATKGRKIDLLSLDVEGNEIDAFYKFPFDDYDINVVTIEMNKIPMNKMHYLMSEGGFYKDISVGVDDFFVKRKTPLATPPGWKGIGSYMLRYHP